MKHFLSLLFIYVWFFTAPLVPMADHDFIAQLDEMNLPAAHKNYIKRFFQNGSQCLVAGWNLN